MSLIQIVRPISEDRLISNDKGMIAAAESLVETAEANTPASSGARGQNA